jgi:hypothetical protein
MPTMCFLPLAVTCNSKDSSTRPNGSVSVSSAARSANNRSQRIPSRLSVRHLSNTSAQPTSPNKRPCPAKPLLASEQRCGWATPKSPSVPLPRVDRRVIWAIVGGFGVRSLVPCNSLFSAEGAVSSGNVAIQRQSANRVDTVRLRLNDLRLIIRLNGPAKNRGRAIVPCRTGARRSWAPTT